MPKHACAERPNICLYLWGRLRRQLHEDLGRTATASPEATDHCLGVIGSRPLFIPSHRRSNRRTGSAVQRFGLKPDLQ